MPKRAPLIRLENYLEEKDYAPLSQKTLSLYRGEHWAWVDNSGDLLYTLTRSIEKNPPTKLSIALISFEGMAELIEEVLKEDDSDFVEGGIDKGKTARDWLFEKSLQKDTTQKDLLEACRLDDFLDRGLKYLSSGELRRTFLAKALLSKNDILIFDSLYDSLDIESRKLLSKTLKELPNTLCIHLEPNARELPSYIDNLLIAEDNTLTFIGKSKDFIPHQKRKKQKDFKEKILALVEKTKHQEGIMPSRFSDWKAEGKPLIDMQDVRVTWSGRNVLDGLSWQVYEGENWYLRGPNGAGKTTLLGLINGENTQAYANKIYLFGQRRGSGETIWEIKRELGLVSWALHRDFRSLISISVLDVLISGLFDTVGVYTRYGKFALETAKTWLDFAGLNDLAKKRFAELSWGEQRLLLILRALIKMPRLLLLDEPCQGLNGPQRERILALLSELSALSLSTILYVSHDLGEKVDGIQNELLLCPDLNPSYRINQKKV